MELPAEGNRNSQRQTMAARTGLLKALAATTAAGGAYLAVDGEARDEVVAATRCVAAFLQRSSH